MDTKGYYKKTQPRGTFQLHFSISQTTLSQWSDMNGACFLQMCCEISHCEVEETLENEEHMMKPDAEGNCALFLAVP